MVVSGYGSLFDGVGERFLDVEQRGAPAPEPPLGVGVGRVRRRPDATDVDAQRRLWRRSAALLDIEEPLADAVEE